MASANRPSPIPMPGVGDPARERKQKHANAYQQPSRPPLLDRVTTPEELIIPEDDGKRATIQLKTRVTPQMLQAIEEVVQSPHFPWRTTSDFIRAACWWMLDDCAKLPEGSKIRPLVDSLHLIHATVRSAEYTRDLEQTFDAVHLEVLKHLEAGDLQSARVLVSRIRSRYQNTDLTHLSFASQFERKLKELEQSVRGD